MLREVKLIDCLFQACWVLHYFSEIKFKQEAILAEAIRLTTNALLTDHDLPVKVEAAIALQMLLSSQEKAQKYVEPQVQTSKLRKQVHGFYSSFPKCRYEHSDCFMCITMIVGIMSSKYFLTYVYTSIIKGAGYHFYLFSVTLKCTICNP